MSKILSFGTILIAGASAQGFNSWGPCTPGQAQQAPIQSVPAPAASQPAAVQQSNPCAAVSVSRAPVSVSAPCGCAQACQDATTNLPMGNCCLIAMPCNFQWGGMNSKSSLCEIKTAIATNPVCSHVKFEWTLDTEKVNGVEETTSACKDIQEFQIKVKTQTGEERELSPIPGGYEAFRVYNTALMLGPYNLELGNIVEFQIKALNKVGWGEWNKQSWFDDKEEVKAEAAPVWTQSPPNGASCVNSFWDGFNCVDRIGNLAGKQTTTTENGVTKIVEKDEPFNRLTQALIQECDYINPTSVTVTRVNTPVQPQNNFRQQMPMQWNQQMPQFPVQNAPMQPAVALPAPVAGI